MINETNVKIQIKKEAKPHSKIKEQKEKNLNQ